MLRVVSFCLALLMSTSATARAAEPKGTSPTPIADAVAAAATVPMLPAWAYDHPQHRPQALSALYGTYAALQVADIVSTRQALAAGAAEMNPLMKSGDRATMLAVKAAAGAGAIYFAERTWKKNRVGAIVLMAAINGASAAIVARNAQHARR